MGHSEVSSTLKHLFCFLKICMLRSLAVRVTMREYIIPQGQKLPFIGKV